MTYKIWKAIVENYTERNSLDWPLFRQLEILRSVHTRRQVAATCCSDILRRQIASCVQQNFVAATSRTDSVWFDFLRLVAATKFCCGDKDFHKNSPVHTKGFVAATCHLTLLLQLVAWPVHMEWSVAATCCCNLSPSVYRPLATALVYI